MAEVKNIKTVYFSPSGNTAKIAKFMSEQMADLLDAPAVLMPYTTPKDREAEFKFEKGDLVIWATPVYAGRIPNKTLDFVKENCKGEGVISIPVAVYGNRNFDNALGELTGIMEDGGMAPAGAVAAVARHAFAGIADGQPDEDDLDLIASFCSEIAGRIKDSEDGSFPVLNVPGERHPEKYYVPKKTDGTPAVFLKAKPVVDLNKCNSCGTCAKICPMGSMKIGPKGAECTGICIKCHGCVNRCLKQAICFEDPDFLEHVKMLQENYTQRKNPEMF